MNYFQHSGDSRLQYRRAFVTIIHMTTQTQTTTTNGEMTMTITIKTDNLRGQIAPLYNRYPQQINSQPAYVEMDENGNVTADSDGEVGGAISFHVYHGRTLRWGVNNRLRGDALADAIDEMVPLFQRVHDGQSVEWDGNNNRGRLDDDARAAHDEIVEILERLSQDESSTGAVWEVEQWLENSAFSDIWQDGKTLAEAVDNIETDAAADNVELDGDIERYLLDRAERANERDECFRLEVLAALNADGRHPLDANGDEWEPAAKSEAK